ncbi:MAG: DNA mismatch repair protein MutL, partial [Bacteroidota bacterium]
GKPEYSRKTRSEQFFFVNKRYVKSPYLNHAVVAAFEGLLKEGYYPSYFLNLEVDPKTIDINIHPTKTEIKFEDEHTLYALLRSAIKHSLGQFNIAPMLDFEKNVSLDTPYNYKDKIASSPKIEVDRSFNPFADDSMSSGTINRSSFRSGLTDKKPWEALYTELNIDSSSKDSETEIQSFESKGFNPELFENDQSSIEGFSYQIKAKYIVKPMVSGILIVDQNRAHQRVLYEKFLKQFTIKSSVSQQLLFPVSMNFSKPEVVILRDLKSDLEEAGFIFEEIIEDRVVLSGIPAVIPESQLASVFAQLISDVEHQVPEQNFSIVDLMAKSMAKSLSIKAGQDLNNTEQMHLVDSLFACKESNLSPDGQLSYYIMEPTDIEKKFK